MTSVTIDNITNYLLKSDWGFSSDRTSAKRNGKQNGFCAFGFGIFVYWNTPDRQAAISSGTFSRFKIGNYLQCN